MVNLDELQKLAEQATPGPWVFHFATGEYPAAFANVRGEPTIIPNSFSDAQFIAAFNPRTALSLIADLRKAMEALEEISKLERTAASQARECLSSLSTKVGGGG